MANVEPPKAFPNKQLFRLLKVEFVEVLREFQCDRCENKLFDHYIANCGHKFCHNCRRLVGDGSGRWRCPQCDQFITAVDEQNEEFEERFYEQEVHCGNKKYGCQHKDKLKNILEHIEICDKTKEAALPVEIITTAHIKNIWEEILKIKHRFEENDNDRKIDKVIEKLNDRNFICSAAHNQVQDFKIEMMKTMEDLNKKVETLYMQLDTLKGIIVGMKEKDINKAKNKIKKIETDINYQKHMISMQTDSNNLKFEKLNQSFEKLKTDQNKITQHLQSNIEQTEAKIKEEIQLDKIQILAANKWLKELREKNEIDTVDIVTKLDAGEGERSQIKDSIQSFELELRKMAAIQNDLISSTHLLKVNIEELEVNNNLLPRVNFMEHRFMLSARECHIILLGETGCGKSLFINALANYSRYQSLDEAITGKKPYTLIPSTFRLWDKNDEGCLIQAGVNVENEEGMAVEEHSTIPICNSYRITFGNSIVRLMSTPGWGDWGDLTGESVDRHRIDDILKVISNYCTNVHVIGIVVKCSEAGMRFSFGNGVKVLLSKLNKALKNNIVFIITYDPINPWNFKPLHPIAKIIKCFFENELKKSKLVFDRNVMFCVDNKCYEYLIAATQGVELDPDRFKCHQHNWKHSSIEMTRLMSYTSQVTPRKFSLQ